jgi:hypothetical protein
VNVRRAATVIAIAVAAASPAFAQSGPSNRGAFAVDAMIAPTSGLGFAYYVTDGLSLRPWLGLGYSGSQGFFAHVGAQLRYEVASGWTVSPYLSASAQYSHSEAAAIVAPGRYGSRGGSELAFQGSGGQFGAGAGLRFRVASSLSLFAEGRVLHATYPIGELKRGWSTFDINDRTRGEVVLGASYLFR